MVLKSLDWNVLSQACRLLESFKTLTDVASGHFVSLSIIPLIRAKITATCAMSDADCVEIASMKTNIMNNLDKRFPMNEFITVATLLDPASKNKKYLNMSPEQKRDLLLMAINEASSGAVLNASSSNRSPPDLPEPDTSAFHLQESHVPAKRLRVMDEFEDEDSDCDVTAMVTQYLSSNEKPSDAERADPLLY